METERMPFSMAKAASSGSQTASGPVISHFFKFCAVTRTSFSFAAFILV